jgi:Flp pilus assembly protein TadG
MSATDERGQVTAFLVVMMTAFLILAGLVVDGGYGLAAKRRAINEASEAARAGAQALAVPDYRSGTGDVVLDPNAAEAAAQGYLGATGHSGTVTVDGDRVKVEVRFDQPTTLLRLIGVSSFSISGEAGARSARGVEVTP